MSYIEHSQRIPCIKTICNAFNYAYHGFTIRLPKCLLPQRMPDCIRTQYHKRSKHYATCTVCTLDALASITNSSQARQFMCFQMVIKGFRPEVFIFEREITTFSKTTEGAISHNVLYYQQLSIRRRGVYT